MKKIFLPGLLGLLFIACNNPSPQPAEQPADSSLAAKVVKTSDYEVGDPSLVEIGKRSLSQLSSGDVDSWADGFADNARYQWSAGDSLVGKKAIIDYWKNRRTKVIDSLQYSQEVWISIKVNKSQSGGDRPGQWLLGWYMTTVRYKNGKKLNFFAHSLHHFNDDRKVDQVISFIDRAPIEKALAGK